MVGARGHGLRGLPVRRLDGGRHEIIHERTAVDVSVLVVLDLLEERRSEAHGEAPVDLPVDDHRVDDRPAVVDRDESTDLHLARLLVDIDHTDVAPERVGHVRGVVVVDGLEPRLDAGGVVRVSGEGDLLHRLRLRRHPLDAEREVLPLDVVGTDLEEVRRDPPSLLPDLPRRDGSGGPRGRGAAARVGTQPIRGGIGVPLLDPDVVRRDPEFLGEDLRVRRLVALALRLRPETRDHLARRVDADLGRIEHLDPEDVERGARPRADDLREARDADPHQLALATPLRLLASEPRVVDDLHRFRERGAVVSAVVGPAERGAVRERPGRDEVLHPQLGRVDSQAVREDVHHPFDRVDRLGDAERAAVGDPTRRLVRVGGVDLDERFRERVGARDDVEEPRGELGGVRRRVRVAVVGERLDAERGHRSVPLGRHLRVDVIVPGERVGLEVLGPVLDPLHRPAGLDRRDRREDVARIDRYLPAEPAPDVGGDDADVLLGEPRHQREDRADRVRRLGRHPNGEPARDRVHLRDAPARFHRGDVDARDVEVLGHAHGRVGERPVGTGSVAGLPVPDEVRRLLAVGPNHRRARLDRLERVGHDRERLVVDLDRGGAVGGGVAAIGDDRDDLLGLVHDGVRGQYHLLIGHQGRHPREAGGLEVLARDHRNDAGDLERPVGADRRDLGVGVRAAGDVEVEHPGELEVVNVAPPAPNEPRVLFAQDRLADPALHPGSRRGHGLPPGAELADCIFLPASWIAFTMFT